MAATVPAFFTGMAPRGLDERGLSSGWPPLYLTGSRACPSHGLGRRYVRVALLLARYLRKFGQFSIPDFLGPATGQHRRSFGVIARCVLFDYWAQIYGGGVIPRFTGLDFGIGVFSACGHPVCSFLGGMRAVTWTQVAQCMHHPQSSPYMIPVVWLSVKQRAFLDAAGLARFRAGHGARKQYERPEELEVARSSPRRQGGETNQGAARQLQA